MFFQCFLNTFFFGLKSLFVDVVMRQMKELPLEEFALFVQVWHRKICHKKHPFVEDDVLRKTKKRYKTPLELYHLTFVSLVTF